MAESVNLLMETVSNIVSSVTAADSEDALPGSFELFQAPLEICGLAGIPSQCVNNPDAWPVLDRRNITSPETTAGATL
jgi:hypothetical protein